MKKQLEFQEHQLKHALKQSGERMSVFFFKLLKKDLEEERIHTEWKRGYL